MSDIKKRMEEFFSFKKAGKDHILVSCPFAKYTHSKGTDENPSMSVRLGNDPVYHCFACGEKGPLWEMVIWSGIISGNDSCYRFGLDLCCDDPLSMRLRACEEQYDFSQEEKQDFADLTVLEEEYHYKMKESKELYDYLKSRGFSDIEEIVEVFGLKYDPDEQRVVLPVYEGVYKGGKVIRGKFRGLVGRDVTGTKDNKVKNYWRLDTKDILGRPWGENYEGKPVALCEGMTDAFAIYDMDRSVYPVCTLNAVLSDGQASQIEYLQSLVYIMYDNDEAGKKGRKEVIEKLRDRVPMIRVCEWPEGCDPASVSTDQYYEVKNQLKRRTRNDRMV